MQGAAEGGDARGGVGDGGRPSWCRGATEGGDARVGVGDGGKPSWCRGRRREETRGEELATAGGPRGAGGDGGEWDGEREDGLDTLAGGQHRNGGGQHWSGGGQAKRN